MDRIDQLSNISSVVQSVHTYDNNKEYFILETNLGITVADAKSGEVIRAFEGITEIEYNPKDGFLYSVYWDTGLYKEFFARANISSGEITTISELQNIDGLIQGNSTFDYDTELYCFVSILGVTIIDVKEENIVKIFEGIEDIEYDHNSGKLIGLSDDMQRKLLSADMSSGEVTVLGETSI